MIFNRDVWATVVFGETSRQDVNLNRNKNAPTLFVMKGVGAFLIRLWIDDSNASFAVCADVSLFLFFEYLGDGEKYA